MRKELDELRATENAKLSWYIITPNGCFEYKTKEFAYKSLRNHPTATHVVHAVKLITVLNPAAAETTPSSIE